MIPACALSHFCSQCFMVPFPLLTPDRYEHPFDRKALDSLNNTPGISRLFKSINEYGLDRLFRFRCLANSLKVSADNFPPVHTAFLQACEALEIDPIPECYLSHGEGYIRSFTVGVNQPIVILNMDGFLQLNPAELVFILGHELGHIKSQHLVYQQAAIILPVVGRFISSSTLGLGGLATNGLELALYQWVMMAKLTCDRAGLLACQDLDVALSTLVKLAGVPTAVLENNTAAIVNNFKTQARSFGEYNLDSLDKITKVFSFLENMKPWAILRASELLKWIDSGDYQALRSGSPQVVPTPEAHQGLPEDWDFLQNW
ncbi:MAG: M48 family metallopeptidase [Prochlorotrichaceae cyanobacterium]